jgi:hypothetical protein
MWKNMTWASMGEEEEGDVEQASTIPSTWFFWL